MASRFDSLPVQQQELIEKHLTLVIEANKTTNLTRIVSIEEAMVLHVEDSLSGIEELDSAPQGLYGDIGTGAGYPGIPLSIVSGRKTLLIDTRKKKMDIVQGIVESLGLANQIQTYAGRAELLAQSMPGKFSALTARALSKLSVLLELASPLLKSGGMLICYKSHVDDDELNDALRVQDIVGMKLVSDRTFTIHEYDRRILVFKKVKKPSVKLPRQEGQAQKNPL